MDILNLATNVNNELGMIQSCNQEILTDQDREKIFNSIVTAVSEGLLDSITFSISERYAGLKLLSWEYDMRDKKYIQRRGLSQSELLPLVSKMPSNVCIDCIPGWSSRFSELDPHLKVKVLKDTIWTNWTKELEKGSEKVSIFDAHSRAKTEPTLDLGVLINDLNSLESDMNLLERKTVKDIVRSVQMCFKQKIIKGVELSITETTRRHPLISWNFVVREDGTVKREGEPIEQIILKSKSLSRGVNLIAKPIFSPSFQDISQKKKDDLMKGTIWARY